MLIPLGWTPACAADAAPIAVEANHSVVLERAAHAFENVKADRGWASSAAVGSGPDGNVLIYVPAAGTGEGTDTIHYKLDGADKNLQVAIENSAPLLNGDIYTKSFKALFVLFILAVLVENGLAVLFRWQPYYSSIDTRRADPLVAFILSLLFVSLFNLDITTSLLRTYTDQPYMAEWPGRILTAMIIAGGSAGVNRIFQALGFRSVLTPEQMVAKPPANEAWLSVRLAPETTAVGEVTVSVGPPAAPAVVGSINTVRALLPAPLRYFLRSPDRFPRSGGYTVTPNTDYVVIVRGTDAENRALTATWGPGQFGPRALIDLRLHPV